MGLYKLYKLDTTITTGIDLIDGQHAELFESFNNVFRALALAKETPEMLEVLDAMDRCVRHHLDTEEGMMLRNKYAKYVSHKKAHQKFLENITAIKERTVKKGVTSDLAQMVKETIGDWFLSHIRVMDMQYVPFLKDKVE